MAISNVKLNNINISSERGLVAVDADGLKINEVKLNVESGPAYSFIQTRNLILDNIILSEGNQPQIILSRMRFLV